MLSQKQVLRANPAVNMYRPVSDYTKMRWALQRKARQSRRHQFGDFAHVIRREDWLTIAIQRVLTSEGAISPGPDGKTATDYVSQKERDELSRLIQEKLRQRLYVPAGIRYRRIPKKKGGTRAIGILNLEDRVICTLLVMALSPIFESDFLDCSTGYRPGRGVPNALAFASRYLRKGRLWVVRADIEDCFRHINHDKLLRLIERRIADTRILDLVHAFLDVDILHARFQHSDEGTPQGLTLSPLLANIYLNELDLHIEKIQRHPTGRSSLSGRIGYIRYADDFAIFCQELAPDAIDMLDESKAFLGEELGMALSQEEICYSPQGFDFLGFHVQWMTGRCGGTVRIKPTRRNLEHFHQRVHDILSQTGQPVEQTIGELNRYLTGARAQYAYANSDSLFESLDKFVQRKVKRFLRLLAESNASYELPELVIFSKNKNSYCH